MEMVVKLEFTKLKVLWKIRSYKEKVPGSLLSNILGISRSESGRNFSSAWVRLWDFTFLFPSACSRVLEGTLATPSSGCQAAQLPPSPHRVVCCPLAHSSCFSCVNWPWLTLLTQASPAGFEKDSLPYQPCDEDIRKPERDADRAPFHSPSTKKLKTAWSFKAWPCLPYWSLNSRTVSCSHSTPSSPTGIGTWTLHVFTSKMQHKLPGWWNSWAQMWVTWKERALKSCEGMFRYPQLPYQLNSTFSICKYRPQSIRKYRRGIRI